MNEVKNAQMIAKLNYWLFAVAMGVILLMWVAWVHLAFISGPSAIPSESVYYGLVCIATSTLLLLMVAAPTYWRVSSAFLRAVESPQLTVQASPLVIESDGCSAKP